MQGDTPSSSSSKVADAELIEYAQQIFQLVRCGDTETLGPLLGKGLPANLCNHKGDSLLMLASYHGHVHTTKMLLDHGADTEIRNDRGQTPLAAAAFQGKCPMVELLLDYGADIEGAGNDGRTALMLAAMFNRTEVVNVLLRRGARLGATDVNGLTALDAARIMGAHEAIAQLERLQGYNRLAQSNCDHCFPSCCFLLQQHDDANHVLAAGLGRSIGVLYA